MKRNWDLLMEILQSVECSADSHPILYPTRETDYWKGNEPDHEFYTPIDATPDELLYHGRLLEQADFVELGKSFGGPGVNNFPRSLAGKPLAPFPADKMRRITVLYGMMAYDKRLRKPTKHRQTTLRKLPLGENRGFRPGF